MSTIANDLPQGAPARGTAWIDGILMPLAEARVNILDRGFVRSDATYDVTHLWKGRFFRLDDYIARFFASMDGLRMQVPQTPTDIRELILRTTRASGLQDAYVQMTCTRGVPPVGTRDPRLCRNVLSIFVQPFVWISSLEQQETGLRMIIAKTMRIPSEAVDQKIKNFHWLDLTRGVFEAYDQGADVAVHPSMNGGLTEGAGFNVFGVRGNEVFTPDTGIFEGMTRRTVLELAPELQLRTRVGMISAEELRGAEEIFLTSTAGGVMPVSTLDGRPVGDGTPGRTTLALRSAYWSLHDDPTRTTPL